ncbi:ABC transporter substrate-binding protein [Nocardioides humi]|uniref:ABC transporter substrate-binding protein n=1 Tax=Nocardioides humi TaxID=449461 RepID=A0ABN2A7H2_9ACTN|nr:extracellular solute-binding protein [Nocardioides humi]
MSGGRVVGAVTSVAAVLVLAGCGGGSDESARVDQAARYAGDDRQGYLEECAREEGSLSVYTAQNTDLWQPLKEGFQRKYPGIKVETTRRTSAETAETLSKEARAGVDKADVVDVKVEVAESLLELLAPFSSPELAAYPEGAIGPDDRYVISDQIPYGIVYNTDKVSDPPKTSEDLLRPEFKGHIAMSTTLLGTQWVGWMESRYGEEFLERLGEQDVRTTDANGNAIIAQVAAGEALVAPAVDLAGVEALKSGGKVAPIAWLPIDSHWTQGALSMAAKAPHPCAAMLYIDYELSAEGQTINPLYLSARDDVPAPEAVQGENEPVDIWEIVGEHSAQAYQDASRRWTELVDRYIVR